MIKPYKLVIPIDDYFSTENKIKKFSIEQDIDTLNEDQFIYGNTKCFSDGLNRNNYYFPLYVLENAAHTIQGKPLLAAFNLWHSDGLGGHESTEVAVGYVSDNAKITFEKSDDGRTFLCADFAIWKYYSNNLPEILKNSDNNKKDVSVELFVFDDEKDEENGYTIVKEFAFCAITILSKDIMPAVENAELEITKFSKKAESVFDELKKYLQNNSKEENMAEENKIVNFTSPENNNVNNATKVTDTTVKVITGETVYNDDGSMVDVEENHTIKQTTVEEVPDIPINTSNEKVDNSCENKIEKQSAEKVDNCVNEMFEKYSALESKFNTLKDSYDDLMKKYSVLEEFKKNKENEIRVQAVECALNDVSDTLSADDISDWRDKSTTFTNVDEFKNALKAFAYDKQKAKGVKLTEQFRNAIPQTFETEKKDNSLWGCLENY